jgi:hypothetical protein
MPQAIGHPVLNTRARMVAQRLQVGQVVVARADGASRDASESRHGRQHSEHMFVHAVSPFGTVVS